MAYLSEDDLDKLFSGAPQYFARSEAHFAGAPHPLVAYPADEELAIRDLTDHVQIEDKAWSGVTSWPHLTRDINHDAAAKRQAREKHKAHYHIRCHERPNMLSMQGLEKGTIGYQAALELPVSDSLEEEQFGFESIGKKAQAIIEAREKMVSLNGWLRKIPEDEILDRLRRNGDLYKANDLRKRPSSESYYDLFQHFMRPADFVIDKSDPLSLSNQINALVKCLGSSNVWIDLSHVEWRIRLGQVLWGQEHGDQVSDFSSIADADSAADRREEKYWLLLQVLIATELLLRLDAVTEGDENGTDAFRPNDVAYFEKAANQTVKWSLLLARSWMENIEVLKEGGPSRPILSERKRSGWLASVFSRVSLPHSNSNKEQQHSRPPSPPYHFTIHGRFGDRQVEGLIHFATKIHWPGIKEYKSRISENIYHAAEDAHSQTDEPRPNSSSSKHSKRSSRSSYFDGAWDVTSHHDQRNKRVHAQRRKIAAALHPSGWLSKSYVFGLMLPGETLSHYLMATLIENDENAMRHLGPFANLTGGFVYGGKSFWSTSCVVGRVLAAGKGSAECMGWVSTTIVPKSKDNGWIHIAADELPEDLRAMGKRARLWGKKKIEKESSIFGDGDVDAISPADFIIPNEKAYNGTPPSIYVELVSLDLLPSAGPMSPTPLSDLTATPVNDPCKCPELPSYPASIKFKISTSERAEESLLVFLSYDINFVTAHPCCPSQRVKYTKSPSSPTLQHIDVSGSLEDSSTTGTVSSHRLGKSACCAKEVIWGILIWYLRPPAA